jgi:SAM-dependent methyltransferase
MTPSVSPSLQSAYANQYADPQMAAWRMLGARAKAQNIIRVSTGHSFNKVLEVGAGDGSLLATLSNLGFATSYTAAEISESGLAAIRQRNIRGLADACLFDGYQLPFADQAFDAVILSHVLEHVEHERLLLRELKRVARYQIIEVPREYRPGAHRKTAFFLAYGHINLYTPTSLQFLLHTEDFSVRKLHLGLYSLQTYLYQAKGVWGRLKAYATYYGKRLAAAIPFLRHRFINTITVLTEASANQIKILH